MQRADENKCFSLWKDIFAGVPQGSLLDAFLFNIYINDKFIFVHAAFLGNYADNTTLYSIQNNPKTNQTILNYNFTTLQNGFIKIQVNSSSCV